MSLLVFLLLARPGGGTGGAEASPPRLRARGAAPEPSSRRGRGAECAQRLTVLESIPEVGGKLETCSPK